MYFRTIKSQQDQNNKKLVNEPVVYHDLNGVNGQAIPYDTIQYSWRTNDENNYLAKHLNTLTQKQIACVLACQDHRNCKDLMINCNETLRRIYLVQNQLFPLPHSWPSLNLRFQVILEYLSFLNHNQIKNWTNWTKIRSKLFWRTNLFVFGINKPVCRR